MTLSNSYHQRYHRGIPRLPQSGRVPVPEPSFVPVDAEIDFEFSLGPLCLPCLVQVHDRVHPQDGSRSLQWLILLTTILSTVVRRRHDFPFLRPCELYELCCKRALRATLAVSLPLGTLLTPVYALDTLRDRECLVLDGRFFPCSSAETCDVVAILGSAQLPTLGTEIQYTMYGQAWYWGSNSGLSGWIQL